MKTWIKGLAIAGLVFSPLIGVGIGQSGNVVRSLSGQANAGEHGTEGQRRDDLLIELTTSYVSRGRLVTASMRDGTELAPIAFLNAELALAGAKWRVATVRGVTAETFAIS